jgi:hypothetical protein
MVQPDLLHGLLQRIRPRSAANQPTVEQRHKLRSVLVLNIGGTNLTIDIL